MSLFPTVNLCTLCVCVCVREGADATREAEPAGHLHRLDQVRQSGEAGIKSVRGFPL